MKENQVLKDIQAERERQIAKGYDAAHDDEHGDGSIKLAAQSFISSAIGTQRSRSNAFQTWPWDDVPNDLLTDDSRTALVKAAACIVAEIERLDRMR